MPDVNEAKKEAATKFDEGKLRWDLLPAYALGEVVDVYTRGAKKYADRNWEKGMSYSRIWRALLSHAFKWWRGEKYDKTDGQQHLASVVWCALALMEYEFRKVGTDDRPFTDLTDCANNPT